jgi:hypothetical protein
MTECITEVIRPKMVGNGVPQVVEPDGHKWALRSPLSQPWVLIRAGGGFPSSRPAVTVAFLTAQHDAGYTGILLVLDPITGWRRHEQLTQPRYIKKSDVLYVFIGEPSSLSIRLVRRAMPAKGARHG